MPSSRSGAVGGLARWPGGARLLMCRRPFFGAGPGGVAPPPRPLMSLPSDHSSGARGKRVGSALATNRRQSLRIRGLAELPGDLVGIEAKARPAAGADAPGAEALGVVVDPAAAHPPPARNLLGGDQFPVRPLGRRASQQLGEAARDRLDRSGIKPNLASRVDRLAHRRLPKGPRPTFGLRAPFGEWWAMRAAAISI